jgi:hypothetical protein
MATLTPTLSLISTDATNDELNFSVTKDLTIVAPYTGVAKTSVTTTGANNIIQPATDGQTYYVYVKHTGVDASGSTVTTTLNIELTGDVVIGKLAPNEFMFMPVGGHSLGVQLQASSGTIVAEYAYFTRG